MYGFHMFGCWADCLSAVAIELLHTSLHGFALMMRHICDFELHQYILALAVHNTELLILEFRQSFIDNPESI